MSAPAVQVEVDTTLGAAYIRLSTEPVAKTVEFSDEIMIDLDVHNVAVGIEVLSEGTMLPFEALTNDFHVHSEVIDILRQIRPDVSSFLKFSQTAEGTSDRRHASEFQDA